MTPITSLFSFFAVVTPMIAGGHAKKHSLHSVHRHTTRALTALPSRGGVRRDDGGQPPAPARSTTDEITPTSRFSGSATVSPEDLDEARAIAARLLEKSVSGAVVFGQPERETKQLQQIANTERPADSEVRLLLSMPLLRVLDKLANQSTTEQPFIINGLYRPLSASRSHEPHGHGQAVDIGGFGGHRILTAQPDECVEAVVAIVKALGPGQYRMGLPKAPESTPVFNPVPPARPASVQLVDSLDSAILPAASAWPFFPAPRIDVIGPGSDAVSQLATGESSSRAATRTTPPARKVVRWANERYAPLEDVENQKVRDAIQEAAVRGANIHSLFPDGLNHLHLDVKPAP